MGIRFLLRPVEHSQQNLSNHLALQAYPDRVCLYWHRKGGDLRTDFSPQADSPSGFWKHWPNEGGRIRRQDFHSPKAPCRARKICNHYSARHCARKKLRALMIPGVRNDRSHLTLSQYPAGPRISKRAKLPKNDISTNENNKKQNSALLKY